MSSLSVFVANALHFKSNRGMWRYHQQLISHLERLGATLLFMPQGFKVSGNHFFQLLSHETIEPLFSAIKKTNIVLYPFNVSPFLKTSRSHILTTIHDLIFNDPAQSTWGARYRRARISDTVASSNSIITVSKTTQSEILRKFPHAARPYIIPCHLGANFSEAHKKRANISLRPRILHMGGTAPSKGTDLIFRAFSIVRAAFPQAVLVLGSMSKQCQWIGTKASEAGIALEHIEILPRLSDDELAQVYADADIHCMPSSNEGFGMPIIEAASQFTPNVLAPLDVFREILGDAALYFKERTPESLGRAIIEALQFSQRERSLAARQRALDFTFSNIHDRYAVPAFAAIAEDIRNRRRK